MVAAGLSVLAGRKFFWRQGATLHAGLFAFGAHAVARVIRPGKNREESTLMMKATSKLIS